jgi:NAD+ synthase
MNKSKQIASWIKKQLKLSRAKGIVVGLSGGIDSAVVAVLSKLSAGNNLIGVIMPCNNPPIDKRLARRLAKKFNIKTKAIDLKPIYDVLRKAYPSSTDMVKANLKARIRMSILYYIANTHGYLVAGTGNKSELMIGYFTKYGDGGCDILPIGGLLKTEVRRLAKELKIPSEIINRPPTAGLWDGQTDESEIGMSYEYLDECLAAIEAKKHKDMKSKHIRRVRQLIENTHHKRQKIPIF